MCGILGEWRFNGEGIDIKSFQEALSLLRHRGPDDEGYVLFKTSSGRWEAAWGEKRGAFFPPLPFLPRKGLEEIGKDHDLILGHLRLAIIDLSPLGHQPMSSEDGEVWIVHNGEVYNYLELRKELEKDGIEFFSQSDTEVIIKAYLRWGIDCVKRFNGMWAFAIWDNRYKKLICARDRLGIKPFYYWRDERRFIFSSEIKALLKLGVLPKVEEDLLFDYLLYGLLDHTERTFFKGIKRIPPAHYLEIERDGRVKLCRYWDFDICKEVKGCKEDDHYASVFLKGLERAIRLRLRSDVPVGSCLSGGLDSSSIVCIASRFHRMEGTSVVHKTFSACFEDKRYDERPYIQEVVRKTKVEPCFVFPSARGFRENLQKLIWHQEEPFSSTSIYAQWEVMRKARREGVVVMLDGQGGDEQLGGYHKFYIFYLLELLKRRYIMRFAIEFVSVIAAIDFLKSLNLRKGIHYLPFSDKILGVRRFLPFPFKDKKMTSDFRYHGDLGERIKKDITLYSLPVLLRYEDKNSMAHGVEARLPFLDHELVEEVASFPFDQKMRKGWTKYVLRQALKLHLPEKIRLRKSKIGFITPEEVWIRGELKDYIFNTFQNAQFLPMYVDVDKLKEEFKGYLSKKSSLYSSSHFLRFFILEHWARTFL